MNSTDIAFTFSTPLRGARIHTTLRCNVHANEHLLKRKVQTRQYPVARVRRGPRPNVPIPLSLYEAESMKDIDLKPFDFSTLRGRVVLVVNVASQDKKADENYKSFASLLDNYHDAGFDVLVFPCNWFGQYETGSLEEIKNFVHSNYSDRIKVMAKINIETNPIFALGRKYFTGDVIWNFHGKFLFGRKGLPVARFDYLTTHEYIDSEVSRYVHSSDSTIHDVVPAPDNFDSDDDDWYLIRDKVNATGGDMDDDDTEEDEEEDEADVEEDLDVERELEPEENE